MGVPARFVGAPLHVFQKPQKRGMLFKAILDGFPKSQRTLVAFVSVLLSETAGAGNGLIRKSLHRRVKTKGQVALRFKPRWPVQRKLWPGAGCDCRPSRGGHQPGGSLRGNPPTGESWWNAR